MTRVLVHQFASAGASPREVLIRLNDALAGNIRKNMFVTMFVGMLDVDTGVFIHSNAGHNPIIVYGAGRKSAGSTRLGGVPVGVFASEQFAQTVQDYTVRVVGGDVVLLYTDGLIESVDGNQRPFTIERVVDIATAQGHRGAKHLVQTLVSEEERFRGEAARADDITLLAFGMPAAVPVGSEK